MWHYPRYIWLINLHSLNTHGNKCYYIFHWRKVSKFSCYRWIDYREMWSQWLLSKSLAALEIVTISGAISEKMVSLTTHGSHRKVLEFECCLEKCLIFQSALKMGSFPWKMLENDFIVLKNISTRKSNLSVLFCTFELRKVARFSNFVIKSPSLLIQWAAFSTVQITKSIFFV